MKREWTSFEPLTCDLCSKIARFSHPDGSIRCANCPRPRVDGRDERTTRPKNPTKEPRHPVTGKRWRSRYNGCVSVSVEMYQSFRRHCEIRGEHMRSVLDAAITAKLDEIEQKEGKR